MCHGSWNGIKLLLLLLLVFGCSGCCFLARRRRQHPIFATLFIPLNIKLFGKSLFSRYSQSLLNLFHGWFSFDNLNNSIIIILLLLWLWLLLTSISISTIGSTSSRSSTPTSSQMKRNLLAHLAGKTIGRRTSSIIRVHRVGIERPETTTIGRIVCLCSRLTRHGSWCCNRQRHANLFCTAAVLKGRHFLLLMKLFLISYHACM
mmetsp:Transcript_6174/g.14507  ORF Transcript_6174/g.14507 Transcript_6174/m.14507 type:complete len:204 (-) Transcript_6174:12-623(-)